MNASSAEQLLQRIRSHELGTTAQFMAKFLSRLITGRVSSPPRLAWLFTVAHVVANELRDEDQPFTYLEVGVMHGGSMCIAMAGANRGSFIGVDPFGYYGAPEDPQTGVPVTKSMAARNISTFGQQSFTLVDRYSTDPDVPPMVEKLAPHGIDLLMIDGDHSYEGAKADFELLGPSVTPGGIVLFDDYDSHRWPGVSKAVDEIQSADWTSVGAMDEGPTMCALQRG